MEDGTGITITFSNPKKCKAFWVFLKEKFANELLEFWLEADNYAHIDSLETRREKALDLYKKYFDPASPSCLAMEFSFTEGLEKDVLTASSTVFCRVQKAAFFQMHQFHSEFIQGYSDISSSKHSSHHHQNKKLLKILQKKNSSNLNELTYVDQLIDMHINSIVSSPSPDSHVQRSNSPPPMETNGTVGFLSLIQDDGTQIPTPARKVTSSEKKKRRTSTATNGRSKKTVDIPGSYTNLNHISLFTNLLYVHNFKLTKLLLRHAFEQETTPDNLIESILSILTSTAQVPDFVTDIFRSELDNAPNEDVAVLFRTDSLSTQFMSKYLHYALSENLIASLGPTIGEIISYSDGLEVDLTRDINADVKTNTSIILNLAQKTLDKVLNKIFLQIPDQVGICCKQVHSVVSEHFDENVGNQVLGSIMFLRFVCPAIVNPEKYELVGDIKPANRRTAVLISKLIQNLVNGVDFDGSKESYMAAFSPFLSKKNRTALETAYLSVLKRTPRLVPTGYSESLSPSYITLREYLIDNMDKFWVELSSDSSLFLQLIPIMKMGLQSLKLNSVVAKMPSAD